MAVASPAPAPRKRKAGDDEPEGKMGRPEPGKEVDDKGILNQPKRSKCPGVRVVGGRIYDSENGKTCHQCRQKTMDFTAACKNLKNDKHCTFKFCHKCLVNRYGEKAEEMAALSDWKCPKCRGICNCSFCMKKRGHKPTGILVHTAKATGFSSVSEMLDVKGSDSVCQEKTVKNKLASPQKIGVSTEEFVIVSPKKPGKENSFEGASNTDLHCKPLPSIPDAKKPKNAKPKGITETYDVTKETGSVISPRKASYEIIDEASEKNAGATKNSEVQNHKNDENKNKKSKTEDGVMKPHKLKKDVYGTDNDFDMVLPQGAEVNNVAGIDLHSEDAGNALQFLEFCATFGEVFGLRKGQAEAVLRDIMCGRSRRQGKCSSAVQFHIQLLSFIHSDYEEEPPSLSPSNGKDSWVHALRKCLSESECVLEGISETCFDKGGDGYEMLESSQKLKLLTFLCDETLNTLEMRRWIDDQNLKLNEKGKEARDILVVAKEKEKLIKQKLQDEVAKAIIAKNGAPLTIEEHVSIVSEIKAEAAKAHAEILEARGLVPKKKQRSDAMGTAPVFLGDKGHVYWTLKGFTEPSILLQDVGGGDRIVHNEKWFQFNDEEKKVIEKFISSIRLKKLTRQKVVDPTRMNGRNSNHGVDLSSNGNE